jgi:hypothetical protein
LQYLFRRQPKQFESFSVCCSASGMRVAFRLAEIMTTQIFSFSRRTFL